MQEMIKGTREFVADIFVWTDSFLNERLKEAQTHGHLVKIESDGVTFVGKVESSEHESGGSLYRLKEIRYDVAK